MSEVRPAPDVTAWFNMCMVNGEQVTRQKRVTQELPGDTRGVNLPATQTGRNSDSVETHATTYRVASFYLATTESPVHYDPQNKLDEYFRHLQMHLEAKQALWRSGNKKIALGIDNEITKSLRHRERS